MKYLIIVILLLSGCSQMDSTYNIGKKVYKVGEVVVPLVPMSEGARATLITVDEFATKYDTARTAVREAEEKKMDANITLLNQE